HRARVVPVSRAQPRARGVDELRGLPPVTTLLVANRGEIARRVIRAGRALGMRCVAVFTDADAASPHVADADEALRLATGSLDGPALVEAALRCGADAVHPGYGYLAENAGFAEAVGAAGLRWVGPPPQVIAAMGDKIAAKVRAKEAGLAVLDSIEDAGQAARLGYPLLVKAAAGGGGKGMRVVVDEDGLADALAGARREAAASFGDDRVFLERYVARSRHVEVQILGDHYGNLVHLGERECSIQRRHQKLIEESPSPALDDERRDALGEAALALARHIGYRSVGTVEFLVDDESGDFFFLEVNTRLQVEHPVTEMVTGVDLVRAQLAVAFDLPLEVSQEDVESVGWAIEARLCAEDPAAGFLPATGTIAAFEPADEPVVRWESGVAAGTTVTVAFDPLLAKVIAYAPTRVEAADTLARALERLHLGGVTTNRDFLAATLRHPAFRAGDTTTDFIARHGPARSLELGAEELWRVAVAGALWLQGQNRSRATVLAEVPSGWRNARLAPQRVALRHGDALVEVEYRSRRDGSFELAEGSTALVHHWSEREVDVEIDGRRSRSRVTRRGDDLFVQCPRGTVTLAIVPRFEVPGVEVVHGGLVAPMPGLVSDVRVQIGQAVEPGETLVVMEAMKMEHPVTAPHAGTVAEVLVL
ncbi:MAG: acetyl/propionyl-CoA carboxylase subunit alpha, partial [Acidobacteriota bacterium]|nr:acetyl/propionyl-CoA carboxylase subunit alpha [Acidobacteriota bacterium]